jgi:hypothetical protein
MEPEDAAEIILDGVRRNSLYIVTHPEALPMVDARHEAINAAFATASRRGSIAQASPPLT